MLSSKLKSFYENGYVVLKRAIPVSEIDDFWHNVEKQISDNKWLTFSLFGKLFKNSDLDADIFNAGNVLRITDMEAHSEISRNVMLHPAITSFFQSYYGHPPSAIQSLTYKYSSQQGAHSDLHLVSPPSVGREYPRDTLAAAWIACEDANEENGALVIYPGSHKFPKKSLNFFKGDYKAWVDYLDNVCKKNGCEPQIFEANKGDVLIWHGDLVHAGGLIKNPDKTRKSFVIHYAMLSEQHEPFVKNLAKIKHGDGWFFAKRNLAI